MFLYLTICPNSITPWTQFYQHLINNSSPAKILLGVNRMLRTLHEESHNKQLQYVAKNILKAAINKFQLWHIDIECLTSGKKCDVKNKNILGSF